MGEVFNLFNIANLFWGTAGFPVRNAFAILN
jgi:hypothetical protein